MLDAGRGNLVADAADHGQRSPAAGRAAAARCRARTELAHLAPRYDLVIIGGGITGAGILREAVRTGATRAAGRAGRLRVRHFVAAPPSWCTAACAISRPAQWRLTLESVRERQRLLAEAPGLVDAAAVPDAAVPRRQAGPLASCGSASSLYDLMAGQRALALRDRGARCSPWSRRSRRAGLLGAMAYEDARTDDARLVLRLILDSVARAPPRSTTSRPS